MAACKDELVESCEIVVSDGGPPKFPPVEMQSGEESFTCVFEAKATLYRFDMLSQRWSECGQGPARILQDKEDTTTNRFIARREGVGKLAANHLLLSGMMPKGKQGCDNGIYTWTAPKDYCRDSRGRQETFAIRLKELVARAQFYSVFTSVTAASVPLPSVALADALLFADPVDAVLGTLQYRGASWRDALVLATPFWHYSPSGDCGKLNRQLDLDAEIPPAAAASMRFDPDRDVRIASFDPELILPQNEELLSLPRRVYVPYPKKQNYFEQLLKMMPQMTFTTIHFCKDLCDLSPFSSYELHALQSLTLHFCVRVSDLSPLASLPSLEVLLLSNCSVLADLAGLSSAVRLQSLTIQFCPKLSDIRPLGSITSLRSLRLLESRVEKIPPILPTGLEVLGLRGSQRLTDVSWLSSLSGTLRTLNLSLCKGLGHLSPLASLKELVMLDLSECPAITAVAPLASLGSLRSLNLAGCGSLTDISALASLTSLKILDLKDCVQLADFSPLMALTSLDRLDLRRCRKLSNLIALKKLTSTIQSKELFI